MNDNLKDELEKEISYKQLINVFLRRKIWFAGVFSVVLSSVGVLTLHEKPLYQSQMQLLLEPNSPELENQSIDQQQQQFSRSKFEVDYATQLTLMQSDELIEQVAEVISKDYPDLNAGKIKSNFIITQVVQNDISTRVFEASYTGEDPIKTQKVLETIQKVYVNYNLERRKKRLSEGLTSINNEIDSARKIVAETEKSLEKFREQNNVIKPTARAQEIVENLDRIKAEKLSIESQYKELKSEYDDLQSQLNLSPELTKIYFRLSESPRYQALLKQLQDTELAIANEKTKYTFSTPNLVKLQDRYQQEQDLLKAEINAVLNEEIIAPNISKGTILTEVQRLGSKEREFLAKLIEMQPKLLGLKSRLEILTSNEQELQNEIDRFLGLTGEYEKLQPEVEIQRDKIKRLLQTKEQLSLQLERVGFNWEIIEAPETGEQISPSLKKNLALGIILGMFLGSAAAFIREATDDTIHTAEDLEAQINYPVLGKIPKLDKQASIKEIIDSKAFQDSIYLIQKNLKSANKNKPLKSLAVTSIQPEEGKSILALGLALNAANFYSKVLLIDGNLRRPSLHKKLNIANQEGLSDLVLSNDNKLPESELLTISDRQIEVITAGKKVSDPIQVFSSQKMKNMLKEFGKKYDFIILDLPLIYGMVDAIEASSLCDGAIAIGRLEYLTKSKLTTALTTIDKLENLLGWVINGVKRSKQKTIDY